MYLVLFCSSLTTYIDLTSTADFNVLRPRRHRKKLKTRKPPPPRRREYAKETEGRLLFIFIFENALSNRTNRPDPRDLCERNRLFTRPAARRSLANVSDRSRRIQCNIGVRGVLRDFSRFRPPKPLGFDSSRLLTHPVPCFDGAIVLSVRTRVYPAPSETRYWRRTRRDATPFVRY